MKKRRISAVQFDGKKLQRILHEKKVNMSQLGVELGYNSNYISQGCYRSSLSPIVLKYIEAKYNISPDDYKVDEILDETEEVKEAEIVKDEVVAQKLNAEPNSIIYCTKEELSEVIYKAVYSAVIHAFND